jgi:glycerol-3-phosphate acyltransferase PlsY
MGACWHDSPLERGGAERRGVFVRQTLTNIANRMLTPLLIVAVIGYLLGSLPFGYLVARAKGVNIFEVGSKNPGATNVRRVLGNGPGNLVLALDAMKGLAAVAFGYFHATFDGNGAPTSISFNLSTDGDLARPVVALIAAMIGHSFSCFTGFRGGKGVATGAGGFLLLFPEGAGIALVAWAATALLSRYASLASMLAAVTLPLSAYFLHRSPLLIGVSAAVAAFVVIRHRANITRLLAGTESKMGRQKSDTPAA